MTEPVTEPILILLAAIATHCIAWHNSFERTGASYLCTSAYVKISRKIANPVRSSFFGSEYQVTICSAAARKLKLDVRRLNMFEEHLSRGISGCVSMVFSRVFSSRTHDNFARKRNFICRTLPENEENWSLDLQRL